MHALLNGSAHFQLSPSPLTEFASSTAKLNPLVRVCSDHVSVLVAQSANREMID